MARNNFLDTMKEKYSYERETPREQKQADLGAFKKFTDYVGQNNNQDLWEWVGKQDDVIRARDIMMNTFNFYLFESLKPQFVEFCKENSLEVIDDYVNTSIESSKSYVSPTVAFEEKEKQLQELVKQQSLIIEQLKNSTKEREIVKI